jgi:hypothetical protein
MDPFKLYVIAQKAKPWIRLKLHSVHKLFKSDPTISIGVNFFEYVKTDFSLVAILPKPPEKFFELNKAIMVQVQLFKRPF